MKRRIRNKIWYKLRQRKSHYTIQQVLEATSGLVFWVRWANGCDYYKSVCDGRIYKYVREDNCPNCKHYVGCKKNPKGCPVGAKFVCRYFEK